MRKHRKSKLDEHAADLDKWLGEEDLTLSQAAERLAAAGCRISLTGLSNWWTVRREDLNRQQLLDRLTMANAADAEVKAQLQITDAPETATLMKLLNVFIMQLAVNGGVHNAGEIVSLIRPVIEHAKLQEKAKDRELDERRLKILEQKAAMADQAGAVLASNLSQEEQNARLREILK